MLMIGAVFAVWSKAGPPVRRMAHTPRLIGISEPAHETAMADDEYRGIRKSALTRGFGDKFDLAIRWSCGVESDYLTNTGSGPGPCLQQTYDGLSSSCGVNVFTGAEIEIQESETDNGDGTVTIIVEARTADGSTLIPSGLTCGNDINVSSSSTPIDTCSCDLAKQDAGGPGVAGDALDPNLGVTPFELLSAEAVVLGAGGQAILTFDLNSAGTTTSELKDRFTVSGVDDVVVTGLQFRYQVLVGDPTGACCFPDDQCLNGVSSTECVTQSGTYFGDFSTCASVSCGPPTYDDCLTALTVTDGVNPYNTENSTLDAGGPVPCDGDMITDVWFSYVATCTGTATFDTCANGAGGDTVMEVFRDDTCPPSDDSRAACEDDSGCGVAGQSARAAVAASAGEDFLIRLAGSDGAALSGNLTIQCTGAPTLGGACCTGPMSCAAVSGPGACPGTYLGDGTTCGVNFAVEAFSGMTHFDTCGSDYNTVLEVFDVCGGTMLISNDDCADTASGGAADPAAACFDDDPVSVERDSCTCLATTAGQGFWVRVRNFGGSAPPPGSHTSLFVTHGGVCNAFASGACCNFGLCSENIRESYCVSAGGMYLGDGSSCSGVICAEPTGACCYSGGGCLDPVAQSDCVVGGHDWVAGAVCGEVNCDCPGDLNGDGKVDLNDHAALVACFQGPQVALSPECMKADLDGDNDCDMRDVLEFKKLINKRCP